MYFPGLGEIWVRWFIVPDDTPTLAVPTVYNSRNWKTDKPWKAGIPGEVVGAPRTWLRGRRKGKCKNSHGTLNAWLGQPAPLLPCDTLGNWFGGTDIGGQFLVEILTSWVGEGGGESDGAGSWGTPGYVSTGGAEGNGTGTFSSHSEIGSGGGEVNGAGVFSSLSEIGSGGGESDGAGVWVVPTPGATCAAAPTLALPFSATYIVPAMGNHWFNFVPTPGVQYHVRISGVSGGAAATADVRKGTCASSSGLFVYILPSCQAAVAGSEAFWLIRVVGDPVAATHYTLEIGTGPC